MRAALLLRVEGLAYDEIAAALRITPGAAKVRAHRACVTLAALQAAREGMAIPALVAAAGCWVGWLLLGRRISRDA